MDVLESYAVDESSFNCLTRNGFAVDYYSENSYAADDFSVDGCAMG